MIWLGLALVTAFAEAAKDLLSKRTMRSASAGFMAWAMVVVAAPLLAGVALATPWPTIGPLFLPAIGVTIALYTVAVLLYMKALQASDLSLALPMIAFTPAFMLITGPLVLGELPRPLGLAGVVTIVAGAYLLKLEDLRRGLFGPFVALARDAGARFMLGVALLFSITATTAKLAITHSSPPVMMAALYCGTGVVLTAIMASRRALPKASLRRHWRGLILIGALVALSEICLAYAVSMSLAVYVISIKRTSILFGALLGVFVLKEKSAGSRLLGAAIMLGGLILIALDDR